MLIASELTKVKYNELHGRYLRLHSSTHLNLFLINKAGIMSTPYHAGLKDKERKEIQQKWTDGVFKVAVATVAFGMGIDLAHVRYVIHWTLSKSVEAFYQESGRAGRDGQLSKSVLYYSSDDASKFQFLLRKTAENKANDGKNKSNEDPNRSMEALTKMINYCTQPYCRRQYLLKHFGEDIDPKTICKKTCDYCIDPNSMDRAMDKCMVDRAKRDVMNQQNRFRDAKKWDDEYDFDDSSHDEFDNEVDLGITHHDVSSNKSSSVGFKSAKDVLSHYEVSFICGLTLLSFFFSFGNGPH